MYTGRNIDDLGLELFAERKRQVFDGFRKGSTPIMLATKAFGMGVDVNDVQNVYHYAASGNLCDYVQEIGRAACKSSMVGTAITDNFYDDISFMQRLFGMSQIKQYQIKRVLEGIYDTHKSKNGALSFLISSQSKLVFGLSQVTDGSNYSNYMILDSEGSSAVALKLLSIFDYITYEIAGGKEPEIFIRLNDPNKVRSIVLGNTSYSNNYVSKSKQKHDRDVAVLLKFFKGLTTDEERWNYIEEYFLGYDVLCGEEQVHNKPVKMIRSIDKEHSYPTNMYHSWAELASFFDASDQAILEKLASVEAPLPEYLETVIKKSDEGNDILMSWPSKDTLICQQDTADRTLEYFARKGWHAYRIYEIDYEKLKEALD